MEKNSFPENTMYEVVEKREDGDAAAWGFFSPT